MLTLYYVSATFLQHWRIQKTCNRISELAHQSSIAFYALQSGHEDGYDPAFASSELCSNRNSAKVTDILWLHGNQRGCCLRPRQTINITPWISFPSSPSWVPIAYGIASPTTSPTTSEPTKNPTTLMLSSDEKQHLKLLLETHIEPQRDSCHYDDESPMVRLENYGKLIAWKIDSHLAILVETDVEHFTKFLIATFLRNNLFINDQLPLLRIESVEPDGNPQPFELLANHLKRSTRSEAELTSEAWEKHLNDLRALSVLAHQATEFETHKNRTEGKAGIVKPDVNAQSSPAKVVAIVEPAVKMIAVSPITNAQLKPAKPAILDVKPNNKSKTSAPSTASEQSELDKVSAIQLLGKQKSPGHAISPLPRLNQAAAATSTPTTQSTAKVSPVKTFVAVKPTSPPPPPSSSSRPLLRRNKDSLQECKPLNVLVYSDSVNARESTVATLRLLLERDLYTIYPITPQQVAQKYWMEQTVLLVVCGSVAPDVGQILVDYFLHGGKVLSLCSDILNFILPNYHTAEVREHELVQFSYDKWQKVKMMHHIFCYQPSPVKKHFSTDSEESTNAALSRKPDLVCPRSMELKDISGQEHKLDVQVLGTEETWNTPSLLLAHSLHSGGKAVFSQVHLETNPSEFESDEVKFDILKQNERTRLEIFADLLRKYLEMQIVSGDKNALSSDLAYKHAYFLGRHESKFELLEKLRPRCSGSENVILTSKLTMKFCGKDDILPVATNKILPILIHSCPEGFSTVEYFEYLRTDDIGRLVIYAPIITSSMHVINDLELVHGIAVLPIQQTSGVGRSNNQWISPLGCAMFSLQLHISMDSPLGSRLPLIQHIIGAAIVNSLRSHEVYKVLDIALKWPNDIYAHSSSKIGGLVVNTTILGTQAIVNIGSGINLNNSKPTLCINDMINEYNVHTHGAKLPNLKYELFIALIFNEIERLMTVVQNDDFDQFYTLYYSLWLHCEQTVKICTENGLRENSKIIGVDDYGFLKVQLSNGSIESVQPDGNSFDMLKGLILPKFK